MADANTPSHPTPYDWSDAFAGIPLERVPADAWARLSAALPVQARTPTSPSMQTVRSARRRPAMRMGLAAAASVAVALPMAWWLGTSSQAPTRAPAVAAATAARVPAHDAAADNREDARRMPAPVGDAAPGTAASDPALETPRLATGIDSKAAARTQGPEARRRSSTTRAQVDAPGATIIPAAGTTPSAVAGVDLAASRADSGTGAAAPTDLATLRQESARLEALVAHARDDRMASAPAAVMSASIDDRIRLIDAALMQPGLDDVVRSSLWNERVGALQELASLEGTQRWMAAHGASMATVARVD